MVELNSLKKIPGVDTSANLNPYGKGDLLVLFGELFSRGYANGIVEAAERRGMTIVYATVGRRTKEGELRGLMPEEINNPDLHFINVPLEAGFDMEKDPDGYSAVEALRDVKMSEWKDAQLDFDRLRVCQKQARLRFQKNTQEFMRQLESRFPDAKNVLFVHLMAGGVPRAKVLMPVMNRVFKGLGDRNVPSEVFWKSPLGRLCELNFREVTAETLRDLIQFSTPFRQKIEGTGHICSYVAYGYHGTETDIGDQNRWQTYSPYLQGWAKKDLELIAVEAFKQGVKVAVFNCPEILTNSSSIFNGVEVSLYPMLHTLERYPTAKNRALVEQCMNLLKPGVTVDAIFQFTTEFMKSPVIRAHSDFALWPQHSSPEQMERMLQSSEYLIGLHKDEKALITFPLSERVFEACGELMLRQSVQPEAPVWWIGHDIIARLQ
jgi:hypothetical protein